MPMKVMLLLLILLLVAAVAAVRRLFAMAQPDEWLLRIRNGRLVRAGVGIHVWRWPGDVVARFTSTVQRVRFTVEALTGERVPVTIEGFILWSVSPEGDAPFRAFQKLGLVNLEAAPPGHGNDKHLLSTPQHRAFRRLLEAAVQRNAASMALSDLLADQASLLARLRAELAQTEQQMGIRVDDAEIVRIRPSDEALLRDMAERTEAAVREEAATARLEVDERTKKRQLESRMRLAAEQAAARETELQHERALRMAELAQRAELARREEEVTRERELAEEARHQDVTRARLERLALERAAHFDDIRREAEAQRDAMDAITSAESNKPQPVRDHELARLHTDRMADALRQLPLKDARWVTVGEDTPTAAIAKLLAGARVLGREVGEGETQA
jgi:flotillin